MTKAKHFNKLIGMEQVKKDIFAIMSVYMSSGFQVHEIESTESVMLSDAYYLKRGNEIRFFQEHLFDGYTGVLYMN
jgi:hypothetical protein